jgi:Ca2+:H+ antiporter
LKTNLSFTDAYSDLAFLFNAVGGLLNATFGKCKRNNYLDICAEKQDDSCCPTVTLLGPILSNMLLVRGCAFFVGGIVHLDRAQVFNKVVF